MEILFTKKKDKRFQPNFTDDTIQRHKYKFEKKNRLSYCMTTRWAFRQAISIIILRQFHEI